MEWYFFHKPTRWRPTRSITATNNKTLTHEITINVSPTMESSLEMILAVFDDLGINLYAIPIAIIS